MYVIFNLSITLRAYLVLYIDVSMSTRIALAVLVQELGTGTMPRRGRDRRFTIRTLLSYHC